jgi:hypothetical protein
MQIENQVVSLDLAKKLKELGVNQESMFVWINARKAFIHPSIDAPLPKNQAGLKRYNAYTVAELGEMLPITTEISKAGTQWFCITHLCRYMGIDTTEANSRAKMLIFLLKYKVLPISLIKIKPEATEPHEI